ncbi:MAG: tyrosine--tRNA ligase [Acidobacteriota bacterium]
MNVLHELEWRGLVYDQTEGLDAHLASDNVTHYIGFDPTAHSLHVGSLLPILALARLQRAGHTPIAVVGGGTGMIGDPSGKSKERSLLTPEQIDHNLEGIRGQLARFLDFDAVKNPATIVNNADWLGEANLIDFLREIGKHFTVNYMLAKESTKRRLASDDGISYTEFSYLLLQSWDFLVLNQRYGCTLQLGGSDQWGNITAGIELIRRMRSGKAHGLVMPLVTSASGVKFGKTEAGTVWLDAELTSPYRFYQFWRNTSDQDVVSYLKFFTFLTRDEIAELETALAEKPQEQAAQKRLALEVTSMVHGADAANSAIRASAVLFGAEIADLSAAELLEIFDDVPSSALDEHALDDTNGISVVELFVASGLETSKGACRRLIKSGGVYVNNRRVTDEQARIGVDDFLDGRALVLRKGQKRYHVVTRHGDP